MVANGRLKVAKYPWALVVSRCPCLNVMDFADCKRWDEESSTPYKVFELSGGWEQLFCEDIASLEAKFGLIESGILA